MRYGTEPLGQAGPVAGNPRYALFDKQFALVRAEDGEVYLTRWWIVKTPLGGIAVHRMTTGDLRDTLHDHPFAFLSIVLRGGYVERRLNDGVVNENHVVRRFNLVRGDDGHAILRLVSMPTWTLMFIGRHRRVWGFHEPIVGEDGQPTGAWRWTNHDDYYVVDTNRAFVAEPGSPLDDSQVELKPPVLQ